MKNNKGQSTLEALVALPTFLTLSLGAIILMYNFSVFSWRGYQQKEFENCTITELSPHTCENYKNKHLKLFYFIPNGDLFE